MIENDDGNLLWSVCKVRTQDPENFDEEVKSLVTALFIKALFLVVTQQIYNKSKPMNHQQWIEKKMIHRCLD